MEARGLVGAMASLSLGPRRAQGPAVSCRLQCAALSARRSSMCAGQQLKQSGVPAQAGRIDVGVVECKLKTRKAAAKRYKITGTGKVFTRRPGKQHINEKKSPKRLRALGKEKEIDHGDKRKVVRCLPYAKIK